MANPVDLASRPNFLTINSVYGAWDFRRSQLEQGPGVADYRSFQVLPRQSGAGMAVDVGVTGVGEMVAWVRGSTRDAQGVYRVDNIARGAPTSSTFLGQITCDVPSAHASLPRIDSVYLRILDADHQGGSDRKPQIQVVPGTATSGATLDNRTGAPTAPADAELLADILVAAGVTSITTPAIRDRRRFPLPGAVASLDSDVLAPVHGSPLVPTTVSAHSGWQAIACMYLPSRLKNITGGMFAYMNGATALAGTWALAIHDASGAKLLSGSGSFSGTANSVSQISVAFAGSMTFERGHYWVAFGSTRTAGSGVFTGAVGGNQGVFNMVKFNQSGGTTLPATPDEYLFDGVQLSSPPMQPVPILMLAN